jgi:sterol desaturase/sphingolipid hydroxylase (fatty acid hydroxylase superfamily)
VIELDAFEAQVLRTVYGWDVWVLLASIVLIWIAESIWPIHPERTFMSRIRHFGVNLSMWIGVIVFLSLLFGNVTQNAGLISAHFGIGLFNLLEFPFWLKAILGFVILDFGDFLFHRLSHNVRWMWLLHSVHHSDTQIDTSTILRNHPLHFLVILACKIVVIVAFGIPFVVMILRDIIWLPLATLHHAAIRIPAQLDRVLRKFFVTPSMHRLHHSPDPAYTNCNYGSVFSLWDRLYGSYRDPEHAPQQGYGLSSLATSKWHSFWGLLATPFAARKLPKL